MTEDSTPKRLQETGITILEEDECKVFNSSVLIYRSKYELCAANKIPYPKMKVYIRKKKRRKSGSKKKNYVFKFLIEQKNPVRKQ